MLFAEPTRSGAGATLWGDYYDLRSLYGTVAKAVDVAPGNVGDFLAALNYDVRHAYEHKREAKQLGCDDLDSARYLGVKILWPHVLLQARLLRSYCAFVVTTREDQANTFRLEFTLEAALRSFDGRIGGECADWLSVPELLSKTYLTEFIDEVTYKYVVEAPAGKKRFSKLPAALRSLSPYSREYRAFESQMQKIAKEQGCAPSELRHPVDWPEFKW